MKQRITLILLGIFCLLATARAQVTVSFAVDAADYVANGGILVNDKVSIAGTFSSRGSTLPDWQPAPGGMIRLGSSRIYVRTLTFSGANITTDSLMWKYVSGTGWGDGDEGNEWPIPPPRSCTKNNENNRKVLLPATGTYILSSKWAECADLQPFVVPTASTGASSQIAQNTASVAGTSGGQLVISRGIVYSTQPNPTLSNDSLGVGSGTGDFVGNLTGLQPNTQYYARAYARNPMGVSYGESITFTTLPALNQTVAVTFRVDITNYLAGGAVLAANGMRIAGNFTSRGASVPDWQPTAAASAMTDLGNNIWAITVTFPDSAKGKKLLYKFVNGNWGADELSDSVVIGGCGEGTDKNRFLNIPNNDATLTYCWERCAACILQVPVLTTTGSTGITSSSAISGGTISSAGSGAVTARGVVWSTSPNPTVDLPTKTTDGTGTGNFTSNITGLSPNTTYYARAYATNSVGTGYGSFIQFTTLPAQAQTVTVTYKVDITNYLAGGATLGANGIRIGGNFTTRGASLPDWTPSAAACAMTNEGNNIWSISVVYPDSAIGKVQRYKFVNNDWGTNEGSDSLVAGSCGVLDGTDVNRVLTIPATNQTYSFCWDRCSACQPLVANSITTTAATAITQTSATVGGVAVGQNIAARGIAYGTSPNPTILGTLAGTGFGAGTFAGDLSNLTPNTLYYARANITVGTTTTYGNEIQFTTLPAQAQTITVTYKVDITNYLAGGATLGTNGIRIGGNFTTRGASLPDWTPSAAACALTNEGNNIWSISVVYPDSAIGKVQRYKFVNNDWGTNEGSDSLVAGGCGVLDGTDVNRVLTIPTTNQTYSFCWDRCSACVAAPLNTVSTDAQATAITQTTAIVSGTATGTGITARGVVYATTPSPTLSDSVETSGSGAGAFSANLTGLTAATLYYARTYITSGTTPTYGNEIQFTTLSAQTQTITVTYKVDITNYLAGGATLGTNGIRIGGNFTTRGASLPDWTPSAAACALTNEGNNIWSISVVYPDSAIGKVQRYKFVNNDWGTNEGSDSLVAGGCGVQDGNDVNRILTIPATNQTYSFCWDRCSACVLVANEEHLRKTRLSLYPNPARESLRIQASEQQLGQVLELVDAMGKTILRSVFTGNEQEIRVETLPAGVYTLRFRNSGETIRFQKL